MTADLTAAALRAAVENTRARCLKADAHLKADAAQYDTGSPEKARRSGKADGVRLALSYLDEEVRVTGAFEPESKVDPVALAALVATYREHRDSAWRGALESFASRAGINLDAALSTRPTEGAQS
jgi:hypothetical protein